jgi:aspartyl-tRNA(Asn)/glutamyl-tRNA(Gln) amidotransferase subunit C
MAKINIDVKYVAALARLELDKEKEERLQREMETILQYVASLSELDVSNIEPTAHAVQMTNIYRQDVSGSPFLREEMLANAPGTVNGELVKVPAVMPGEEES